MGRQLSMGSCCEMISWGGGIGGSRGRLGICASQLRLRGEGHAGSDLSKAELGLAPRKQLSQIFDAAFFL